ncbi:MAG: membrane integrity-associated transporter subunit PqiC [Deltaproteobacteria bacterium]|nr:membrane integrity-associated transporter subunit PqiC [Deltaproteobacteria bacterium]
MVGALVLSGCWGTTTAEQRFYTLSLPQAAAPAHGRHNAEVWVKEVEIAPVYNRPQIVFRFSPQELQFFGGHRWADRPSRMVGQLLERALTTSGVFSSVVSRLGTVPPLYVLDSSVEAIEELEGGNLWYAHLAMTFRLARFDDNRAVWQYSFDERRPLNRQDLGLVARALSEILDEQLRIALQQMEAALDGKPVPEAKPTPDAKPGPETKPVPSAASPPKSASEPPAGAEPKFDGTNGTDVNWRASAQYHSDTTTIPAGQGALFLPSLSLKAEREPPVTVQRNGKVVGSGGMGRRIVLPPGQYDVSFGSGPAAQHLTRSVRVEEGRTTVVTPDWAALDVSVVNAKFIPFLGAYEIIRMDDREYMGVGYGVDEELGQRAQVWVLRPGLYKIVQSGSTYRARTNFATVQLLPGMAVPYLLVQDEASRDFLGAGVAEPDASRWAETRADLEGAWRFRTSLGGSVLLGNRTEGYSSAPVGSSLGIDVFSDNRLTYTSDPHVWTTRLEIEEGQSLQPTIGKDNKPGSLLDGRLQSVKDRVYFNSIYIYQFLPWVGPYLRVGGETTLVDQQTYFEKPTQVVVQNTSGTSIASHSGVDGKGETSFVLSGPLTPVQLKQGAGVNFRVLHNTMADLDLRSGLGSRQYLARSQLVAKDNPNTPSFEVREVASTVLTGFEASALGQLRLTRYVQGSTELDALLPFDGVVTTQLNWRSALSLRLGSFASLTYTLNVVRQPHVRPDVPWAVEQGLQLRFHYAPM